VVKNLKSPNNGQELSVMNFVVLLCRLHGVGMISDRIPPVQSIRLFKNYTRGKVTVISDEVEQFAVVRNGKNMGCDKSLDEDAKSGFLWSALVKGDILSEIDRGHARSERYLMKCWYKLQNIKKAWTWLTVWGVGQPVMPATLAGSILTWLLEMTIPRYSIEVCAKAHFSGLR
jgi:hypothetical protein